MRSTPGRLYALSCMLVVFFLLWALVAAQPWVATGSVEKDRRLTALERRERLLRHRAAAAKTIVDRRWARYQRQLARRQQVIAAVNDAHLRQLEAAYRSAVSATAAANARADAAERYAVGVVAWANQQLAARGSGKP